MRNWKLLLIAVVVAVGIVGAIDYLTDGGLAFQKVSPVEGDRSQMALLGMAGHGPAIPLPDPVGAPDAKVRLQAFVASGNPCHGLTILTLRAAAEALPKHIRLEFADTNTDEGRQAATAAGINCLTGLLINSKRNLEYQDKDGKMQGFEVHGPLNMMSADFLPLALAHALRSQYADAVSPTDIDTLTAAVKKALSTSGSPHGPGPGSPLGPGPGAPHGPGAPAGPSA